MCHKLKIFFRSSDIVWVDIFVSESRLKTKFYDNDGDDDESCWKTQWWVVFFNFFICFLINGNFIQSPNGPTYFLLYNSQIIIIIIRHKIIKMTTVGNLVFTTAARCIFCNIIIILCSITFTFTFFSICTKVLYKWDSLLFWLVEWEGLFSGFLSKTWIL